LKNIDNHLLRTELEIYILVTCLRIVAERYNISPQEKKEVILQAVKEIFPEIF